MDFVLAPRFHIDESVWTRVVRQGTPPPVHSVARDGRTSLPLCDEDQTVDYGDCVAVWNLPEHLQERAWQWLEANFDAPHDCSAITAEIIEFLRFKQMPLPRRIEPCILVRVPNADSTWLQHAVLANLGDAPCTVELAAGEEALAQITLLPREGLWLPEPTQWRSLKGPVDEPEVLFVLDRAR